MVEYVDGSVIAQISATDMRMPIQYALTYPERAAAPVPRLDWSESAAWTLILPISKVSFRCLKLAYEAQAAGGSSTAILNAADEIAVEAFLGERIPFLGIAETVAETLTRIPQRRPGLSISELLEMDREARRVAADVIQARWGERVTTESAVRA